MINEVVSLHRIISDLHPSLDDLEQAVKDEIAVKMLDIAQACRNGKIKKSVVEDMIREQTWKYEIALQRINNTRESVKELNKSLAGGL